MGLPPTIIREYLQTLQFAVMISGPLEHRDQKWLRMHRDEAPATVMLWPEMSQG